jgi:hypothetical protein
MATHKSEIYAWRSWMNFFLSHSVIVWRLKIEIWNPWCWRWHDYVCLKLVIVCVLEAFMYKRFYSNTFWTITRQLWPYRCTKESFETRRCTCSIASIKFSLTEKEKQLSQHRKQQILYPIKLWWELNDAEIILSNEKNTKFQVFSSQNKLEKFFNVFIYFLEIASPE